MQWFQQFLQALWRPVQWWVVLAPWEQGVRIRLGKRVKVLCPGLWFKIPFLDRVCVLSVRLRTITDQNQTLSTKDGRTVVLSVGLQFAVRDVRRLFESVSNPEATLRTMVQAKVAQCVSTSHAEELTPARIEEEANKGVAGFNEWGLSDLRVYVIGFAMVRTYRLITSENSQGAGLWDIEGMNDGRR